MLASRAAQVDEASRKVAAPEAYVAELAEVDTEGIPPMTHVAGAELAAPLRPDEVQEGLAHEDALAAAPKAEHGGFAVPTFVE